MYIHIHIYIGRDFIIYMHIYLGQSDGKTHLLVAGLVIYTHTHTHTYIYIYIYIYIQMYIYTYTYIERERLFNIYAYIPGPE